MHSHTTAPALSFELVNPSDPYTFMAPSLEIAALAVMLVGGGHYGGTSLDNPPGPRVPIFLSGGHDEWFRENFGRTVQESLDACDRETLAACLEGFKLGSGERSSLNDIGGRARAIAAQLREPTEEAQ